MWILLMDDVCVSELSVLVSCTTSLFCLPITSDVSLAGDLGAHPNWTFNFEVKFYPIDAAALHEDYTR